jgi:hypothetical protein
VLSCPSLDCATRQTTRPRPDDSSPRGHRIHPGRVSPWRLWSWSKYRKTILTLPDAWPVAGRYHAGGETPEGVGKSCESCGAVATWTRAAAAEFLWPPGGRRERNGLKVEIESLDSARDRAIR